eukprot:28715_1
MQYYLLLVVLLNIVVKGLPDGISSWTVVLNEWASTPSTSTAYMGTGYNKVENTVWFFGGYIDSCCAIFSNYIIKFNVSSRTFEYDPNKWVMPQQFAFANSVPSSTTVNDIIYLSPTRYETGLSPKWNVYHTVNEAQPIYKFDMTQEQWFNVPETYIPRNHDQGCIVGEEIQNILVITGGFEGNENPASWIYYNLTSDSWSSEITNPIINIPRNNHKCIISNDYLYIMGGRSAADSEGIQTIERIYIMDILNIINYHWQLLSTTLLGNTNDYFGINVDPSGNLYMTGGHNAKTGAQQNTVSMLNIRTLLIERSLPLPVPNIMHASITTRDNQFFLFGGVCRTSPCDYTLKQYMYSNILPTKSPTAYIRPDQFYNSKFVLGGFTNFDSNVATYNFQTLQESYSEANLFCQNAYGTTLAIIKSSFDNNLADELCILYGIPCLI